MITEQQVVNFRRPTPEEAMVILLQLADRLERQGQRITKAGHLDDHQKAGLAAYLKTEASNLRQVLARVPRVMD